MDRSIDNIHLHQCLTFDKSHLPIGAATGILFFFLYGYGDRYTSITRNTKEKAPLLWQSSVENNQA